MCNIFVPHNLKYKSIKSNSCILVRSRPVATKWKCSIQQCNALFYHYVLQRLQRHHLVAGARTNDKRLCSWNFCHWGSFLWIEGSQAPRLTWMYFPSRPGTQNKMLYIDINLFNNIGKDRPAGQYHWKIRSFTGRDVSKVHLNQFLLSFMQSCSSQCF